MADEPDRYWIARMNATGRAQARYLWVLFLACIFYWALYSAIDTRVTDAPPLHVPVVGLDLDPRVVLASGPSAIAFVVLVLMGALRATKVAVDRMGARWGLPGEMERFDEHPNALELALYTTAASPSAIAAALYVAYPLLLVLTLIEAAWLWVVTNGLLSQSVPWQVLRVLAILLFIPATFFALQMLAQRVKRAIKGEHKKPLPPGAA